MLILYMVFLMWKYWAKFKFILFSLCAKEIVLEKNTNELDLNLTNPDNKT